MAKNEPKVAGKWKRDESIAIKLYENALAKKQGKPEPHIVAGANPSTAPRAYAFADELVDATNVVQAPVAVVTPISLDHQRWNAVGLGQASWGAGALVVGALAGAFAIAIPTSLLIALGDLTFVAAPGGAEARTLALSIAVLAPAALTEELLLRGYPFTVLRETWGWPVATAITSFGFGLLHLNNPGATPLAIANVMAAGVFLAGIRVVTGSLAAAWAAHFAWNWTMSAGFHTPVSGLPLGTPDYRLVDTGPDWLSGGVWGPEGGAFAAVGMIGAFAGLAWATERNRRAGTSPDAPASLSMNAGGQTGVREHEV